MVCRLFGAVPDGAVMAGFRQEAGFYFSAQGPVALLAVPLGHRGGTEPVVLRWDGGERRSQVRVVAEKKPARRIQVPAFSAKFARAARTREKALMSNALSLQARPPDWSDPWRWPLEGTPRFSSLFGLRRTYNKGQGAWTHKGLDLRAAEGRWVLAPAAAQVRLARGGLALSGGTVVLDHGYRVGSAYFHLSKIAVEPGQAVLAGQVIGASGATGIASGPHLHWQVELNGHPVDPAQWTEAAFPVPSTFRP